MIKLIVLLISLISSLITTYFIKPVNSLYFILFVFLFLIGYILVQVILFFLSLTLICLFTKKEKTVKHYNKTYRKIFVLYTRMLLSLFGIKLHVTGFEKIPTDTTFVLTHNHLSNLDPIILNVYLRKFPLTFMAKKSISKVPWFGLIVKKIGFLFLERDGSSKDAYVLARGIKMLRNDECSIGISPEGTRNFTDEVLLPFKEGSFLLAMKAKKPIVISVITKVEEVKHNLLFKKHDVDLDFVEILEYEDFKDLSSEELSKKVYDIMYNHLINKRKLN